MFRIIHCEELAENVIEYTIEAPDIARHHRAGQFCIIRVHSHCERIPLSIAETNPQAGTITLVVQIAGHSTQELAQLEAGDSILDVVGPLGQPTKIGSPRRGIFVGGGVGVPAGSSMVREMKQAGAQVLAIIGFRTRDLVIYEEKIRAQADELVVTTDDGSYGYHGLVTEPLQERLAAGEKYDVVITVGPVVMMRAVAEVTRPYGTHTIASLNPIMMDGTGMCGACRVTVGGETKFACVDGPEFDAHQVDFAELAQRLEIYRDEELRAHEAGPHECRLEQALKKLG